jgi:acyl-CoA hydrolase
MYEDMEVQSGCAVHGSTYVKWITLVASACARNDNMHRMVTGFSGVFYSGQLAYTIA